MRQGTTVWLYNLPTGTGCVIGQLYPSLTGTVDNPIAGTTYTGFTVPVGQKSYFQIYRTQGDIKTLTCTNRISTYICNA